MSTYASHETSNADPKVPLYILLITFVVSFVAYIVIEVRLTHLDHEITQ